MSAIKVAAPAVTLVALLVVASHAAEQSAPAAFDVTSVKRNESGGRVMSIQILPGGRFQANNATLRTLIFAAYDGEFREFQIVDGPPWIDSGYFDVDARADRDLPPDQVAPLIRTLLADRFKLTSRRETRQLPGYALVVARTDGRLGPRLKASSRECVDARGADPRDQEAPRCGLRYPDGPQDVRILGTGVTMARLASALPFYLKGPVVDRTGLTELYDLEVDFTRDHLLTASRGDGAAPLPPDTVSAFTAFQEQLGLRLETQRQPVEVLVITGATLPDAN